MDVKSKIYIKANFSLFRKLFVMLKKAQINKVFKTGFKKNFQNY